MAKFKVGDMVVCPRSHKDDHGHNPFWFADMDQYVGKPMRIKGTSDTRERWQMENEWYFNEDWLEPYTEEDDVIRVGDMVERINVPYYGIEVGDRAVVIRVSDSGQDIYLDIRTRQQGYDIKNFKKIKAGGPVSTTQKPSSHEQVPSEFAGQWDRCREEQPVRARRPAGRVVPAVADLGNPARGKERRALVAKAQVELPAGCKSDR